MLHILVASFDISIFVVLVQAIAIISISYFSLVYLSTDLGSFLSIFIFIFVFNSTESRFHASILPKFTFHAFALVFFPIIYVFAAI